ncbi:hypothetical protein J0A71_05g11830 [Encephalitozoon cuniculi]|nr:hypothetical protein J0A71_05g11830 [Encephalitozoon cuniculi]
MLGAQLSLGFFLMAGYVTAQAMKLRINEGNPIREIFCDCKTGDLRCIDSCSEIRNPRNGNPKALRIAEAKKPAIITVKKIVPQEEKPFIKFVEKNIEKGTSNGILENGGGVVWRPPGKIFDRDGNTISYNGSVYKICDLYDWASRSHRTKERLVISDDLKALYEYVLNNPRIERICTKSSAEYPTLPLDLVDSTPAPPNILPRVTVDRAEPVILEKNNVIPVFIRESFDLGPEAGTGSRRDEEDRIHASSSVSIVTLKTTSVTTTTTKIRKQDAHSEPLKRVETQTILTTRTVTRQRASIYQGANDTTKTILKTIFVGKEESGRHKIRSVEDQGSDAGPQLSLAKNAGIPSYLLDIQILEKIKSLLSLANHSTPGGNADAMTQQSRTSISPQTASSSTEKSYVATTCKSSSAISSTKEVETPFRDDPTRELVRSIFDMLRSSTTASENKGPSSMSSKDIKVVKVITTVTETATRTRNYTLMNSAIPSVELRNPRILSAVSSKIKESSGASIYEDHGRKLDELYRRIAINEEQYKNLVNMILSVGGRERDEDNALLLLKKLYNLHKNGAIYEKSSMSLLSERRPKPRHRSRIVEPDLDGSSKSRIYDLIGGGRDGLGAPGSEDSAEDLSSLAYKKDGLWRSLEDGNTNEDELDATIFPIPDDSNLPNEVGSKEYPPSIVSRLRGPAATEKLDGKKILRKERMLKSLQNPMFTKSPESKNDRDALPRTVNETDAECKTVTDTIRTTAIREFDSSMHLSAVSSVVEEHVKRLEKKLDAFSDKVSQIGDRLLSLRSAQNQKSPMNESIFSSEAISPVISRSSIYNEEDTSTKVTTGFIESSPLTASVETSEVQKPPFSSLSPLRESSVSHGLSTFSAPPQTMGLGEDEGNKEQNIDGVVEKIKQKKISDESLIVSDDAVIDDIVEKLAPLVNDIKVSSLNSTATSRLEMSPQSVV